MARQGVRRSVRSISYSEMQMAHTCEARHAFAYTGHLTGGRVLSPKTIARTLSDGRAWGAAVAAWHSFPHDRTLLGAYEPFAARLAAYDAMRASYAADIAEQARAGVRTSAAEQVERENNLAAILDHHMSTTTRLDNLTLIEQELDVPIPSRTGRQASTRYRFRGFIDGFTVPAEGGHVIVEFKFRDELTPVPLVRNSRQPRQYAWAYQQMTGASVVGALVAERWAQAPKPPKLVKAKRKSDPQDEYGRTPSHDKDQLCTPDAYIALCEEYGVEPREHIVANLRARRWQQQVPIMFRQAELEEAGRELVSSAQHIRDLDLGYRYPVRNTQNQLCRRCRYLAACPSPEDTLYLETLYAFGIPKRLRGQVDEPIGDSSAPVNPFEMVGR